MNELTESRATSRRNAADVVGAMSDSADEADLIERAKRDPAAFGELYEAHYTAILNYLYRRTLSAAVAEELTSNTFFKALRGLPAFHSRPAVRFRAWLYRIATNEAGMHWRSLRTRGATQVLPDDNDLPRITFLWPETETPEAVREKQARFALMHQALGRLPEVYRTVLTLRYFEGLPLEEIAAILEKPLGTIKSLVHRGLDKLANTMKDLDDRQQISDDSANGTAFDPGRGPSH
jgi:RNA polymerase sigma-70 factor (ECF subfamily)